MKEFSRLMGVEMPGLLLDSGRWTNKRLLSSRKTVIHMWVAAWTVLSSFGQRNRADKLSWAQVNSLTLDCTVYGWSLTQLLDTQVNLAGRHSRWALRHRLEILFKFPPLLESMATAPVDNQRLGTAALEYLRERWVNAIHDHLWLLASPYYVDEVNYCVCR